MTSTINPRAETRLGASGQEPEHIFGLENFGNTCYCNSVVQALYHTKPFREYLASLGEQDRPRRLSVPGKSPFPTPSDPQSSQGSGSGAAAASATSQRSGLSALKSKLAFSNSSNDESPQSMSLDSQMSLDSATGSVPVVGFLDDSAVPEPALPGESQGPSDIRKRNALIRGPIINLDYSCANEYGLSETFVTALKDLFDSISENASTTGVASPARLIEVLKSENELFRSSMHQDAQEFLNFVLNRVVEEGDRLGSGRGCQARNLFSGEITNEMRCLSCENVTRRNENFFDFSLDTEPNTSIVECLRRFSKSEVLGGTNKFYCDVCGGHQEALKRMKVRKAPPILVLHLKRFKFSEEEQRNTKLLHRVLYSRYLRLPVTTDDCPTPEKLYELKAVIVHLGGGPYQGHYVSVVRTDSGWLLFDDEIVDRVDATYVDKFFGTRTALMTAYLLLYQEVSEEQHERDNTYVDPEAPPEIHPDEDTEVFHGDKPQHHHHGDKHHGAGGESLGSGASVDSFATPLSVSSSPSSSVGGSGLLSRYDSVKRKRRESKMFGFLRS